MVLWSETMAGGIPGWLWPLLWRPQSSDTVLRE